MVISGVNAAAVQKGITAGMVLADARALIPDLEVQDDKPDLIEKLLKRLAEWCIRFSPVVATDSPDGLLLDVTGCSHLWGGDQEYLADIEKNCAHGDTMFTRPLPIPQALRGLWRVLEKKH